MYRGVIVAIVAIIGISMIGTGYLSGNDNDGGWFNNYWNSDNNWFNKYWDYFDYKKFMGFMSSGGSDNDDDKCDCEDRKKDHKEHYDGYKKYYDDNKNHFDNGDYKKYLDDYKKYFDNNRQGFDKTDFKQYMDYYKKYLDDNKKYFNDDDYKKYSDEHKKYSGEYPHHDDDCKCMDGHTIDHAIIDFNIGIRELKENGQTYFQNIVDECIFESAESFAPLCIKCKFLKMDGTTVVAKGEVIELGQSYTANQEVVIPMSPVPWAEPYTPVANDVQDVDKVEITICGKNCVPTFADFTSLKHGSRQTAINNAMASSGISVSAVANSGGYNEVIIFDADKTGTADTDLQVGGGKHLLIIAENLVDSSPADGLIDSPDDSANGGTISVHMTTPMFLKSFVLVDHENDPSAVAKAYSDDSGTNLVKSVMLPITGDGQFTTVFMNAANVKRLDVTFMDSGGITNIDLKCSPPDMEGCTPGFWKQSQHFKFWKTYKTTDKFGTVFGITSNTLMIKVDNVNIKLKDATLLQALKAQGGGLNALARHAVAALLNAASGMNYAYTVDEVKSMVKNAIMSGSYETTKNKLEEANEKGCPFDKDCDCDDRKDHYYKYYDNHKKHYDDNKSKYKSSDYKNYMDEHKKYLDNYGKYMEKSDYKMHTDYFKKFLDDNKSKFSSSDYKKYSDEHKKYSNDYNNHHDDCRCDDDDGKDHHDKDDHYKDDKDYKYKYGKDHDD